MHYSSTAFSANGKATIRVKKKYHGLLPDVQLGDHSTGVSDLDIAQTRGFYRCNERDAERQKRSKQLSCIEILVYEELNYSCLHKQITSFNHFEVKPCNNVRNIMQNSAFQNDTEKEVIMKRITQYLNISADSVANDSNWQKFVITSLQTRLLVLDNIVQ